MTERESGNGIRLLRLWDILCRESDSEHPLGTEEIRSKLAEEGIFCDRRTLYKDMELLNANGYEILCRRGRSNLYFVEDRGFDIPEIRILMDAVSAASFIPEKKTDILVGKIASLAGNRRAEVLKQHIVDYGATAKGSNERIFYTVDTLSEAIVAGKKIAFCYFDYNVRHEKVFRRSKKEPFDETVYTVNPLATVFHGGTYYLFCYDDWFGEPVQYRVDRMDRLKILEEPITPPKRKIDLASHKRQLFDMYGGEEEKVSFTANRFLSDGGGRMLDVLFDRFGGDLHIAERGGDRIDFSADVQLSPAFFSWCASFGADLKITAPRYVVELMQAFLRRASASYREKAQTSSTGLSKTEYMHALTCPKMMWLDGHRPEEQKLSAETASRFAKGNAFADGVKKSFGDYIEVRECIPGTDRPDRTAMAQKTEKLLAEGTKNIAEAAFLAGGHYCAVDMLCRTDEGFVFYEIKDSAVLREQHIRDAGFQCYILDGAGINPQKIFAVTRDADCGTKVLDITARARAYANTVAEKLPHYAAVKAEEEEPFSLPDSKCKHPFTCLYYDYCHRKE